MTDCRECGRGSGHKMDCTAGRRELADAYRVMVPERCPCGHPKDGEWRCLNGRVYGPCEDPACYGVCADIYGGCTYANGCCDDDEDY